MVAVEAQLQAMPMSPIHLCRAGSEGDHGFLELHGLKFPCAVGFQPEDIPTWPVYAAVLKGVSGVDATHDGRGRIRKKMDIGRYPIVCPGYIAGQSKWIWHWAPGNRLNGNHLFQTPAWASVTRLHFKGAILIGKIPGRAPQVRFLKVIHIR